METITRLKVDDGPLHATSSTAFEMRHTHKGILGSNPTLSAIVNPWGARDFSTKTET